MDCKTCKGTGHIEFERGAVVKNCPHCKGTGSVKFITLCDALIGPIIKERNEARAERDALRAQVEAMQADSDLYRQWFNAVQDCGPRYLERKDYEAAIRLLERLGVRVPLSVVAGAALQAKP